MLRPRSDVRGTTILNCPDTHGGAPRRLHRRAQPERASRCTRIRKACHVRFAYSFTDRALHSLEYVWLRHRQRIATHRHRTTLGLKESHSSQLLCPLVMKQHRSERTLLLSRLWSSWTALPGISVTSARRSYVAVASLELSLPRRDASSLPACRVHRLDRLLLAPGALLPELPLDSPTGTGRHSAFATTTRLHYDPAPWTRKRHDVMTYAAHYYCSCAQRTMPDSQGLAASPPRLGKVTKPTVEPVTELLENVNFPGPSRFTFRGHLKRAFSDILCFCLVRLLD